MSDTREIMCAEEALGPAAWSRPFRPDSSDLEFLQNLEQKGALQLHRDGSVLAVSGTNKVGLIILPSGTRLKIRSKINGVTLFRWLVYLGKCPEVKSWIADEGFRTGKQIGDILVSVFLRELDLITQLYLRRDFVKMPVVEQSIRGRIDFKAIPALIHRLPRIPQERRERSEHTVANRVLATALDVASALVDPKNDAQIALFSSLRNSWESIRRGLPDIRAAARASLWAPPPGYGSALQIAVLILNGFALDERDGTGGQAFVMSLASMWEKSLRRMCKMIKGRSGWKPVRNRVRYWDDSPKDQGAYADGTGDLRIRRLVVDVLLKNAGCHWVLDAKYKRSFSTEHRVDRFQMCAYGLSFDAQRVSMVFPALGGDAKNHSSVLTSTLRDVWIDSIALPMAEGPDACEEALLTHLTARRGPRVDL